MSFINSVLANISGSGPPTPLVIPRSGHYVKKEIHPSSNGVASAVERDIHPSSNGVASASLKRKAEQQDSQPNTAKLVKRESRPVPTPSLNVTTTPLSVKKDASTTSKPPPASPNPVSAAPPPRKGTFADILARAQAAQATNKPVGVIKHKPVEKLSMQERRALKMGNKRSKIGGGKSARATGSAVDLKRTSSPGKMNGQDSRSNAAGGAAQDKGKARVGDAKSTYKGTSRPARVETEYKGTARPARAESDYKGTARRPDTHSPTSPGRKNGVQRNHSSSLTKHQSTHRYAEPEDDDDEDDERYGEEGEEDQIDSEGSSDMEAAAYEVEEEEFTSLKRAKKEDEEALREEMELKRKKLERKKALQALAAKRG
ncbi:MAG: hypothetical protein M1816_005386 [Peltula sp. TS41687]|nr:MAG: hypothetical protein M1816_005386 [Peltula sp. TS41687]